MARFRRRPYRRSGHRHSNLTWQPVFISGQFGPLPYNAEGNHLFLGMTDPGVGTGINAGGTARPTVEKFTNEHTLERIRGYMSHEPTLSTGSSDNWFPLNIGATKVPAELANMLRTSSDIDCPNLFDSSDGEDFFFMMNHLCNVSGTPETELRNADSKAKRRFNVGDAIAWFASLVSPVSSATLKIDFTLNLRLLWRLG